MKSGNISKWHEYYIENARQPLYQKRVARAKYIIQEHVKGRMPYLNSSGGKDSQAMLILVCSVLGSIGVFHRSDTLDFPDLSRFCRETAEALGCSYYEKEYDTLTEMKNSGWDKTFEVKTPKASREFARENGYDLAFIGLRKQESSGRKFHLMKGYNFDDHGIANVFPIADFSGEDVMTTIISSGMHPFHVYDHHDPPHSGRLSWMVNPRVSHRAGEVYFLKKHYPEQFAKLSAINPKIRSYV